MSHMTLKFICSYVTCDHINVFKSFNKRRFYWPCQRVYAPWYTWDLIIWRILLVVRLATSDVIAPRSANNARWVCDYEQSHQKTPKFDLCYDQWLWNHAKIKRNPAIVGMTAVVTSQLTACSPQRRAWHNGTTVCNVNEFITLEMLGDGLITATNVRWKKSGKTS